MTAYEVFLEWFKESDLELKEENAYEVYDFIRNISVSKEVTYFDTAKGYVVITYVLKHSFYYVAIEIEEHDNRSYKEMFLDIEEPNNWFFVEPKATLKFEKI
jgi:hypothetical protein